MKIKHLKNQMRSFTLASGKSLYLYPMAENIEISEQDFYLSSKLQKYVKDTNAVAIQEEEKASSDSSSESENLKSVIINSDKKQKKLKQKKQRPLEE